MKILIKFILFLVVFLAGITTGYLGNELAHTDLLCNEPQPALAIKNIEFDGVTIHKGAYLPLRGCEYADRFTLHFGFPKDTDEAAIEYASHLPEGVRYAGGISKNEQQHNK